MLLKVKSPVFIDRLSFELNQSQKGMLKAILRDDKGSICSSMETELKAGQQVLDWEGLSDLPYGEYTLEILSGANAMMKAKLVKRV
jgi:hypothetical protein